MRIDIRRKASGFTIAELLIMITVFAIGLGGIVTAINTVSVNSVSPMMRKQSMAVAESMLEEVLLQSGTPGPGTGSRQNFDDVDDYNGFSTTGIQTVNGAPIAGLGSYNLNVTVANATLGGAPAKLVTVTVSVGAATNVRLQGYKFAYN